MKLSEETLHSLREAAKKEERTIFTSDPNGDQSEWIPGKPLCTCGRYQCVLCQFTKEIKEAVDAEIERRKKLKEQK